MQLLRAAVATSSATRRLVSRLSLPAAPVVKHPGLCACSAKQQRRQQQQQQRQQQQCQQQQWREGAAECGFAALAAATAGGVPWSRGAGAVAGQPAAHRAMATPAAAAATDGSTSPDTGVLVVYVTAPSSEVGESLAEALVTQSLVACVNILPGVTSVYRWQGKLEKDAEVLLVIKTTTALLPTLTAKVKELHPYDTPEVIALPVVGGSDDYLAWVKDSTAAALKRVM